MNDDFIINNIKYYIYFKKFNSMFNLFMLLTELINQKVKLTSIKRPNINSDALMCNN